MMSMLSQIRAGVAFLKDQSTLWLLAWIFPAACMVAALVVQGPLGAASPVELLGQVLCVAFFVKATQKLELLSA